MNLIIKYSEFLLYIILAQRLLSLNSEENTLDKLSKSPLNHKHFHHFKMAYEQSGGFFNDITNRNWLLKLDIHCNESLRELQEGEIMSRTASRYYQRYAWNNFFAANYEPTFGCSFERKIGSRADGGKWTCDPHRIPKENCLVYSFGSNEQFDYEEAILQHLGCEIHTFDPTCAGVNAPKGVTFHRWGIGTETAGDIKNITYIISELGHQNRTIDILKIDIEGGEYDLFTPAFFSQLKKTNSYGIRQIQIELHPCPNHRRGVRAATDAGIQKVRDLFNTFANEGYVIFHKEPNTIHINNGNFIEFAFVLLDTKPGKFNCSVRPDPIY